MAFSAKKATTRTRLLDAATTVFGRKGFTDATIAEICDEAQANIAAVNYHFGSKEELYKAAWVHAFEQSNPSGDMSFDATGDSPRERLRYLILQLIRRITNPDNSAFAIMEQEFAHPTGLLGGIVAQTLAPHKERFNTQIAEIMGASATTDAVDMCRISIIAQCFHLNQLTKSMPTHGNPLRNGTFDPALYAEHVCRFSLGGIEAIRKELEA